MKGIKLIWVAIISFLISTSISAQKKRPMLDNLTPEQTALFKKHKNKENELERLLNKK